MPAGPPSYVLLMHYQSLQPGLLQAFCACLQSTVAFQDLVCTCVGEYLCMYKCACAFACASVRVRVQHRQGNMHTCKLVCRMWWEEGWSGQEQPRLRCTPVCCTRQYKNMSDILPFAELLAAQPCLRTSFKDYSGGLHWPACRVVLWSRSPWIPGIP